MKQSLCCKPNELLILNTMIPNHSHLIEGVTGGKAGGAERFRRLKGNELVTRGDFVEDGNQGFEPWEGSRAEFVSEITHYSQSPPADGTVP